MRAANVILLATAAAAQSSIVIPNPFRPDFPLTPVESNGETTTYTASCTPITPIWETVSPSGSAASSSTQRTPSDIELTPIPAPTTPPRLVRRQDDDQENDDEPYGCAPYQVVFGPGTWGFHLADATWTINAECSWEGELTKAPLSCTLQQDGSYFDEDERTSAAYTMPHAEVTATDGLIPFLATVPVVTGAATPTPSGPSNSSASGPSTPSAAGSGGASESTGLAPAGPLPTGAMMFVGSAAGIFAAALAL